METQEFLTVEEAAQVLRVHDQTVRRWIKAGELPAARLGREYRIKRGDLDDYVERRKTADVVESEALSAEDLAAIREGLADIKAGRVVPWEQLREELRR